MNMADDIKNSYTLEQLSTLDLKIDSASALSNLKNPDCEDFIKIFSIINIDDINSSEDADIVLFHLTNHTNPIREAVAYKLEQIVPLHPEYFISEYSTKQFLAGLLDINPNVSRAICNILRNNNKIASLLYQPIIDKINQILKEFDFTDKKSHAQNKYIFSLYWLLEGLFYAININNTDEIYEILNSTIEFSDYTIREKTAQILAKLPDCPCELLQKAKSDVNFYVKNQVYDKINFED